MEQISHQQAYNAPASQDPAFHGLNTSLFWCLRNSTNESSPLPQNYSPHPHIIHLYESIHCYVVLYLYTYVPCGLFLDFGVNFCMYFLYIRFVIQDLPSPLACRLTLIIMFSEAPDIQLSPKITQPNVLHLTLSLEPLNRQRPFPFYGCVGQSDVRIDQQVKSQTSCFKLHF